MYMMDVQNMNVYLMLIVFTQYARLSYSSMSCPPLCEDMDSGDNGECVTEMPMGLQDNDAITGSKEDTKCKMSPLSTAQKRQWETSKTRLQQLKGASTLTLSNSEPIFDITKEQENEAIMLFPGLFRTREEIDRLERRTKRQSMTQLCEPLQVWNTVALAVNYLGNIVQVIQPSGDMGQWILEETCKDETSPTAGKPCDVTTRTHNVLVYDFVLDKFEIEPVDVFCCVAFNL